MGLAGVSLGHERQSSSSEPHRFGAAWHRLSAENSVTNSRADCALTQQMIGCIDGHQPLREKRVGRAVL